jgi:hypothetical protein
MVEARDERGNACVGLDFGRVEGEFTTPDEPRVLAEVADLLEKPLEDVDPEPLPDAGQAGVVGQLLVQAEYSPTVRTVAHLLPQPESV